MLRKVIVRWTVPVGERDLTMVYEERAIFSLTVTMP